MRKCPLFLVMVALLLIGHPALAKGPLMVDAEISGPGLVQPLSLRDHFGPDGADTARFVEAERFRMLAEQSKVYEGLYSDRVGRRPRGELGPRFTIRWSAGFIVGPSGIVDRLGRVTTYLYPYAEAGPVTLIPALEIAGMQIQRGWHATADSLVDDLKAWGLPHRSDLAPDRGIAEPDRGIAEPDRRIAEPDTKSPATWGLSSVLTMVVACAVSAGILVVTALRRRPVL